MILYFRTVAACICVFGLICLSYLILSYLILSYLVLSGWRDITNLVRVTLDDVLYPSLSYPVLILSYPIINLSRGTLKGSARFLVVRHPVSYQLSKTPTNPICSAGQPGQPASVLETYVSVLC